MTQDDKWLLLFEQLYITTKFLPNEGFGEMYKAIFNYIFEGIEPYFDDIKAFVWADVKRQIDERTEEQKRISEMRSAVGKKGKGITKNHGNQNAKLKTKQNQLVQSNENQQVTSTSDPKTKQNKANEILQNDENQRVTKITDLEDAQKQSKTKQNQNAVCNPLKISDKKQSKIKNTSKPDLKSAQNDPKIENTPLYNIYSINSKRIGGTGGKGGGSFIKPTVEEIRAYCDEQHFVLDAEKFYDYYESNGWVVGKTKMKSWKATVRNWVRRDKENQQNKQVYGQSNNQASTASRSQQQQFGNPWEPVAKFLNSGQDLQQPKNTDNLLFDDLGEPND